MKYHILNLMLAVCFCFWLLPVSCLVSQAHHQHDALAHALCLFDAAPDALLKSQAEGHKLCADTGSNPQRVPGGQASCELDIPSRLVLMQSASGNAVFDESFTYALLHGDPSEHVPKA